MKSTSIQCFAPYPLVSGVLEHISELVVCTDIEGVILLTNRAFEAHAEIPATELCGSSLYELDMLGVDVEQAAELYRAVVSGEEWSGPLFSNGGADRVRNGLTKGVPLRDPSGAIAGCVLISCSAHAEVVPDEQVLRSQKLEAIGQMAAGIAHEINTPTQYIGDNVLFLKEATAQLSDLILRYGDLLKVQTKSKETKKLVEEISDLSAQMDLEFILAELPGAIERTIEGNKRVAEVVRAMKEFAHPGVERTVPSDLNHLIENAIAITRNEWKYVAEMVLELDGELPLVPCIPGAINQVILNLIINAAHAVAEKLENDKSRQGRITISTARVGEWAEVRLEDTGAGIPDAIRDRIFDPFFTTKGIGKGTGQGLYIAHSIIKDAHDGVLDCTTKVGEGTTFVIRLPLKERKAKGSPSETVS